MAIRTNFKRTSTKRIEFGAVLTIDSTLSGVPADALSEYLSDPVNVIGAAWPRDRIQKLGEGSYRLRQDPLVLLAVTVDNFVDVCIKCDGSGHIEMQSQDIESRASFGFERQQRVEVDLDLRGDLDPPVATTTGARLRGQVQFQTGGDLIGPLIFAPDRALEAATSTINRAILQYANREFATGIKSGFNRWWTPAKRAEFEEVQKKKAAAGP